MRNLKLFVPKKNHINRKNNRIASQIKEYLATAIIKEDFLSSITITYVDLSPDIRNCIIYFDTRDNKEKVLATLESKIHHFKDIIAKKMKIKFIPNIKFKIDDIIENSTKINQLLNKISFTSNDS